MRRREEITGTSKSFSFLAGLQRSLCNSISTKLLLEKYTVNLEEKYHNS